MLNNPNVVFEVRITVTAAPPPGGGGTPPPSNGGSGTTGESSDPVPNTGGKSGRGPGGLFHCSASGAIAGGAGPLAMIAVLLGAALLRRR